MKAEMIMIASIKIMRHLSLQSWRYDELESQMIQNAPLLGGQ